MKMGINIGFGYEISSEERFFLIREAGFDTVSLDFEQEFEPLLGSPESQVKLAEQYGLTVESAHLTGVNMTSIWTDGTAAELVTQRLIDELKLINTVGVPTGVAHVTWGMTAPPEPNGHALNRFRRAAETAERYNVKLALENSVFAEHVHYLLENIQSEHVGFCYDSGHENCFTPKENYLEKYGNRLFTMHLHDNNGLCDSHTFPFCGTINWPEKVALLRRSAISDCLFLEIGYQPNENPESLLTKAYQTAKRLKCL